MPQTPTLTPDTCTALRQRLLACLQGALTRLEHQLRALDTQPEGPPAIDKADADLLAKLAAALNALDQPQDLEDAQRAFLPFIRWVEAHHKEAAPRTATLLDAYLQHTYPAYAQHGSA